MMATEAQRLIGISLAKIAQSRCGRGGVSLHKNLLVATVLQKARFIFMEEAYHMVHGHYLQANKFLEPEVDTRHDEDDFDDSGIDDIFNTTASSLSKDTTTTSSSSGSADDEDEEEESSCDKENSPPADISVDGGLTYFDLDVNRIQRQTTTTTSSSSTSTSSTATAPISLAMDTTIQNLSTNNNKRRREVTELETEEAVLSILPKRIKSDSSSSSSSSSSSGDESDTDNVFTDDDCSTSPVFAASILSENISREFDELNNNNIISNSGNSLDADAIIAAATAPFNTTTTTTISATLNNNNNNSTTEVLSDIVPSGQDELTTATAGTGPTNTNTLPADDDSPSMEGIDRITSLVSIFSFGNLTRSVSTPDLCSAQAKDNLQTEGLQQRTFLAMTV